MTWKPTHIEESPPTIQPAAWTDRLRKEYLRDLIDMKTTQLSECADCGAGPEALKNLQQEIMLYQLELNRLTNTLIF